MAQDGQSAEGTSDTGRSRERVDRDAEPETAAEEETSVNRLSTRPADSTILRSSGAATVASASSGPGGAGTPGTVTYDTGPEVKRLAADYDIGFCKDGQARKVQRLESEFGSETVQRWADEGMTVDVMGKPRDMEAFRHRKANRSAAIPDDIERQNQASVQRNVGGEPHEGPAGETTAPESVRNVISKPGTAMDEEVQREMESKMGGDFSDVQLHTGTEAAAAADSINARAFTVGNNVAFNDGEYDPGSESGKKVLAHELTHVRQQTDGRVSLLPKAGSGPDAGTLNRRGLHVQPKLEVSSPGDPAEKEAERVAQRVVEMDGSEATPAEVHNQDSGSVARAMSQAGGTTGETDVDDEDDSDGEIYEMTINGQTQMVQGGTVHTVEQGENLSVIAEAYSVRDGWRGIYRLNQEVIGDDPNLIHPGDELLIPETGWQSVDPTASDDGDEPGADDGGESQSPATNQSTPDGVGMCVGSTERESDEEGLPDVVEDLGQIADLDDVRDFFIDILSLESQLSGELWFELPVQLPWGGRINARFEVGIGGGYDVEDDIYDFEIGGIIGISGEIGLPVVGNVDIGMQMGPSLEIDAEDPVGIWELWQVAIREDVAMAVGGFFEYHPIASEVVGNEWHHAVSPETILDPIKDAILADEQATEIMREMSDDEKITSSFSVEGTGEAEAGGAEIEAAIGAEAGRERTSETGELLDEEDYVEGFGELDIEVGDFGVEIAAAAKFYEPPGEDDWEFNFGIQIIPGIDAFSDLLDNISEWTEEIQLVIDEALIEYLIQASNNEFLPVPDFVEEGIGIAFQDQAQGGGSDSGAESDISVAFEAERDRNGQWELGLALISESSVEVDALVLGGSLSTETVLLEGSVEF